MASVVCPACSRPFEYSRAIFRPDFRCPHCGEAVVLSRLYTRSLLLLSLLIGFVLTWQLGGPRECVFGIIPLPALLLYFPVGFLILMVLIRTVPFLIRPNLVLRRSTTYLTTLNLTAAPKHDRQSIAK
jgi:DNA-directed RNA polymerase subunit RPC12/RpoP